MKKYKFRLQPVLDLKEKKLEEKMLEFSKLQNILQLENTKLSGMYSYRNQTTQALSSFYERGMDLDISQIQIYKNYLVKVAQDISQQLMVIENVKKMLALKQQEVNQALKEKKIYEKLKENGQKNIIKK